MRTHSTRCASDCSSLAPVEPTAGSWAVVHMVVQVTGSTAPTNALQYCMLRLCYGLELVAQRLRLRPPCRPTEYAELTREYFEYATERGEYAVHSNVLNIQLKMVNMLTTIIY